MAAAVARAPSMPPSSSTPPPHLSLNTSARGTPAPVPNKHLPVCSPGPQPNLRAIDTPPASPPCQTTPLEASTLLSPPDGFPKISTTPPIHSIDADTLARALDHIATQPLPEPKQVFPWLHGLHADNQIQLAFFVQRRKSLRKVPRCIRAITVVKAGGDLGVSKLKGAIPPSELLLAQTKNADETAAFLEIDPKDGFSVRNFQIQACKMATVSDIVVYGDERTSRKEVLRLAERVARAQEAWRERQEKVGCEVQRFSTFVVTDKFSKFEEEHPEIVAVDSNGIMTGNVMDFFYWERLEMCTMSAASEISTNVFLGPSPDHELAIPAANADEFDILIEASDQAPLPDKRTFTALNKKLQNQKPGHQITLQFPSSGSIMPPTWSHAEVDGLLEMCRWIYSVANPPQDEEIIDDKHAENLDIDGDSVMDLPITKPYKPGKKVLIHCADGYTESSLLGLTYLMYAAGLPVHTAYIALHVDKNRNFFTYPSDVALLTAIQPRILQESPNSAHSPLSPSLTPAEPSWLARLDGSLPSRILPYMYLGNLLHANNPALLSALGITHILSVGEPLSWPTDASTPNSATTPNAPPNFPPQNLLHIDRVQDNGVDPLTTEFPRCLAFIAAARACGGRALVHCRVGVSRSATICIAEVMRERGVGFGRAYCFVRARRLNVIIQPHLRFVWELLKWEECLFGRVGVGREGAVGGAGTGGLGWRREAEWGSVCREIAGMNRPYSRG